MIYLVITAWLACAVLVCRAISKATEATVNEHWDGTRVYRYPITAHDGTLVVIWAEDVEKADMLFLTTKWGKKPWRKIGAEESCGGK